MKRHPALRALSSEHQSALVLGIRCQRASDVEARELWTGLRDRFARELEPHFAQEERTLLPALARLGQTDWVERTLSDHAQLRALCASTSGEFDRATLAAFGQLLWSHVRFEETVLFEQAQERLSAHDLEEVARAASGEPYGD